MNVTNASVRYNMSIRKQAISVLVSLNEICERAHCTIDDYPRLMLYSHSRFIFKSVIYLYANPTINSPFELAHPHFPEP